MSTYEEITITKHFCEIINDTPAFIGNIIEFGTGSSYSTQVLANLINNKKIITFDGFIGLPKTNKVIPHGAPWQEGHFQYDYETIKNTLAPFNNVTVWKKMSWELDDPSNFDITEIAGANFDFDLYEGTLDGLRFIQKAKWSNILLRFDDWGAYEHQSAIEIDEHEKAAFFDWINETGYKYNEHTELTKLTNGLQSIITVTR